MAELPKPGDAFESRYRIESIIGKGGFGCVYLAAQTDLTRNVALKVMRAPRRDREDEADSIDRSREFSIRFEQEANLVSQLRDPHTVRMFDYGRTETGLLYMVLEYIDGISLHELLKSEGALPPERAVKILRQILHSLHEAHTLGVLHRDIKPGNVMVYEHVGRKDLVKVLDFGLAKALHKSGPVSESDLTHSGILIGTPRYMSPEQIRGESLSPASDLYGVGLIAYELLAGSKAVSADTPMVIVSHHLDPSPFALPPDLPVPGALRNIVDRLLRKNPAMRYQTADEVLNALEQWDSDGPAMGDASTRQDLSLSAFRSSSSTRSQDELPQPRSLVGVAVAVACVAVVGAMLLFVARPSDAPSASPAANQAVEEPAVPEPPTQPVAAKNVDPPTTSAQSPPPADAGAESPADHADAAAEVVQETVAKTAPKPARRPFKKRKRNKKPQVDVVPLE